MHAKEVDQLVRQILDVGMVGEFEKQWMMDDAAIELLAV